MSIIVFTIGMIFSVSIAASADNRNNERGEPFSAPSAISRMPEKWKQQPVRYISDFMKADIVVDINQQLEPLLEPLIQEYAKSNNLKIRTTKGTCGKSAAKIDRKEIDIAGFCCPPGEKDRLPGLKYHTMGIVPLALLIHPDNPVDNLTLEQARRIFMGDITNWSQVGGKDMPIKKIASNHCNQRPGHWKLFLASDDLFSPDVQVTGEMEDMIVFVATNPGSIGYEAMMVAERFKHRGTVKALKINGYEPVPKNLLSLDYSIYRTFNLTSWEGDNIRNPHAQKLVDYLMKNTYLFDKKSGLLPAAAMRKAGWKFHGNEVIGEPDK